MNQSLNDRVTILLVKIGDLAQFKIKEISEGANNRVYKLETVNAKYLMKTYFKDKEDKRNRLSAEFGFSDFLWSEDIHCIPRPVVQDRENNTALFDYIEGRKISPEDVDENRVSEALDFWVMINSRKSSPRAKRIPKASEAYFSINGHLNNVSNRLKKLNKMKIEHDVSYSAKLFVNDNLIPFWDSVKSEVATDSALEGVNINDILHHYDRCLSPSDFGFHNAILTGSGALKFFDFEYAGWDDPAKFVCDFFCQPEIPVSMKYFPAFSESVSAEYSDAGFHQFRMNLLLPVYQMKWCAILLNDFLSTGNRRREFSNTDISREKRLGNQLEKSMNYFKSTMSERAES